MKTLPQSQTRQTESRAEQSRVAPTLNTTLDMSNTSGQNKP